MSGAQQMQTDMQFGPVDMDIYSLMTHSPFQIDALFQALRSLPTLSIKEKDFKVGMYPHIATTFFAIPHIECVSVKRRQ